MPWWGGWGACLRRVPYILWASSEGCLWVCQEPEWVPAASVSCIPVLISPGHLLGTWALLPHLLGERRGNSLTPLTDCHTAARSHWAFMTHFLLMEPTDQGFSAFSVLTLLPSWVLFHQFLLFCSDRSWNTLITALILKCYCIGSILSIIQLSLFSPVNCLDVLVNI